MDEEDRLAYIRECKAKLGLDDNVLLKSAKRTLIDQQRHQEMPSLDFNGYQPSVHGNAGFQPSEMAWSLADFRKDAHQDFLLYEETRRGRERAARADRIDNIREEKSAEVADKYEEIYEQEMIEHEEKVMNEINELNDRIKNIDSPDSPE